MLWTLVPSLSQCRGGEGAADPSPAPLGREVCRDQTAQGCPAQSCSSPGPHPSPPLFHRESLPFPPSTALWELLWQWGLLSPCLEVPTLGGDFAAFNTPQTWLYIPQIPQSSAGYCCGSLGNLSAPIPGMCRSLHHTDGAKSIEIHKCGVVLPHHQTHQGSSKKDFGVLMEFCSQR